MGISSSAFAQGADDEEEGWIEEPAAEEEEEAPAPPPPPKKKKAKKKKKKVIVVDEEVEDDDTPPAWTRGRRGKPKKVIPAREGEPTPPGYTNGYQSRKNIWIPGVVLLGTGYLASALTSSVGLMGDSVDCWEYYCDSHDWGWGFVPLVGPFVIAANDDFDSGWRAGYALFGIAQNLGLALTIAGAASKRPVWVLKPEHRRGDAPAPMPEVVLGPGNIMVKTTF
jgi:hypothetical protein